MLLLPRFSIYVYVYKILHFSPIEIQIGWNFQIVPFLTLGIGVDNVFLLLHNYRRITENVQKNEIGLLMKETGMSVVMASINNILSFLAGTILPIPALRDFCAQVISFCFILS